MTIAELNLKADAAYFTWLATGDKSDYDTYCQAMTAVSQLSHELDTANRCTTCDHKRSMHTALLNENPIPCLICGCKRAMHP